MDIYYTWKPKFNDILSNLWQALVAAGSTDEELQGSTAKLAEVISDYKEAAKHAKRHVAKPATSKAKAKPKAKAAA